MKKILILGASGFIGRHLKEELSRDKGLVVHVPTHKELELLNPEETARYIEKGSFDVIFHTAVFHAKPDSDIQEIIEKDKQMYENVSRCREYFGKMIYIGSGAEYDKRFPIVKVSEDEIGKTIPISGYGIAKYEIGQDIEKSENIYNFRVFGMFGYGEDWRHTFISNAICKSLYGYPISIRQDVEFTYMWIKDFCKIARWAIDADLKYHTYNMGTNHTYKLSGLATIVKQITGNEMPVFICKEGLGNEYTTNGRRFMEEFPEWKETDIRLAIKELYEEYKKHKEDISLQTLIYGE